MMEKRLMVLLACAVLLFSACVSEEKPTGMEVLNRSFSAMNKVSTYSFAVKSSMLAIGGESYGGEMMEADLSWGGDVDGSNRRMHVVAKVVSGNSTTDSEQYIMGGRQYLLIPMFGWVMNETDEEFWENNSYSKLQPNPSSVDPVLVGEEKINGVDCYVIEMNLSSMEAFEAVMQQPGSTEGIQDIKSATMREWIRKDTFLMMRSESSAHIIGSGMEAYMNTTIDFSDYDTPKSIQLPAEAENAIDVNALMSGALMST